MPEDQPGAVRVVHVAVHATSVLAADILIAWLEVTQIARCVFDVIVVPDPQACPDSQTCPDLQTCPDPQTCPGSPSSTVPQRRAYDVVVVGSLLEDRPVQELLRLAGALGAVHAQAPVVIISDDSAYDRVCACINHGVRGFIPSTTQPMVALAALEIVILGGTYVPPLVVQPGRQQPASLSVPPPPLPQEPPSTGLRADGRPGQRNLSHLGLTPREVDVLDLLALGQSNRQIAKRLGISVSTAMVHVRNLMRKMGATNRTQTVFNARCGNSAPWTQ